MGELKLINSLNRKKQENKALCHQETGKNDPHVIFNRNGEILDCCDDCLIFFAYDDPKQLVRDFFTTQPKYQPCGTKTKDAIMDGLQSSTPFGCEVLLSTKGGHYFQADLEFFPISDELVVCFFGEKFAKEASDNNALNLLEQAPGTVFLISETGSILYCNQHALSAFGVKNTETFAAQFFPYFSKKFQQNIAAANFMALQIEKAMQEGMSRFIWHIRRDYNEIAASMRLVRTEFGGKPCCIAYLVEFEADIENYFDGAISRNFLDDATWPIMEAMPFAWKFLDSDLNCLECNKAIVELLGAKDKESFIKNYHQIYPHMQTGDIVSRNKMLEYLDIALEKGVARFEWELNKFDGTPMIVQMTLSPVVIRGRFVFSVFMRDFTEAKALHEQRGLDKERLEAICDNAPIGIQIWNYYDEVLFTNQTVVEIFGFESVQDYEDGFNSIFPEYQPDGRRTVSTAFDIAMDVIKTGNPATFDWTLLSKNGEPIPLQRKFFRINYGGEHCLMEFCQDMRPYKEKEAVILREAQNLRTLFNAMPLIFEFWNERRELAMANDFALDFFGLPDFKTFETNLWNLAPSAQPCGGLSVNLFADHMEDAFALGKKEFEWMCQSTDGTPIPTYLTMTRVEFEGKAGIICIYQDLREQIARDEIIKRESKKFKLFFNAVTTVCMFWDDRQNLIMCNPASAALFGLDSPEDFVNKFHQLSPPVQPCGACSKEKALELVRQTLEMGHATFEWQHQTISGEHLPCKVVLTRTEFEGKPGVIGILHDLREAKAAEEQHKLEIEQLNTVLTHMPLGVQIWSKDDYPIFINNLMAELLNIGEGEGYRKDSYVRSPEIQENGRKSREYGLELLHTAFETGHVHAHWTYQTDDGQPIPMDCTLIRIDYGGVDAVLELCRDLRQEYAQAETQRATEEKLRLFFDHMPLAGSILDANLNVVDSNAATSEYFGFDSKQEYQENFKATWPKIQPDGRNTEELFFELASEVFELGRINLEVAFQKKDETPLPAELTVITTELENQPVIMAFAKDLRAHYQLLERERKNQESIRAMLDSSPLASFIVSKDGRVLMTNDYTATLLGLNSREDFADDFYRFFPDKQPDGISSEERWGAKFTQVFASEQNVDFEWLWQNSDKEYVPCQIALRHTKLDDSEAIIVHMQDLRQIKKATEAADTLQKMVHTDGLTSTYSRRFLDEESPKKFAQCIEQGKLFSVIMIDLDNFKTINDTHGHQVGDEVLKILATRTAYTIRQNGFVARYGGEEFVVVMPGVSLHDAAKIALRIRKTIEGDVFLVNGIRLEVTASLGVASKDEQTSTNDPHDAVKHIIDNADKAMYFAKHSGKNMVAYHHQGKNIPFDCSNKQ
ncbi:MAG: sensor domain-containing diguanylate cyclase [Defluviitaleaceae bacterium]|nr:sensor domain-containing diguanylate cyclase [Defluviitaleaceae bacterium]